MSEPDPKPYAVFDGAALIARGTRQDAAVAAARAAGPVLAFDPDGKPIDFDTRGSEAEVAARYAPAPAEPRGRGRPKLGVVAREVTLLPRHWDWLARQPGGASVALRKLVEQARSAGGDKRASRDAVYSFLSAMAGDRPGFEEAMRALYAGDGARLDQLMSDWPADIVDHARTLLGG